MRAAWAAALALCLPGQGMAATPPHQFLTVAISPDGRRIAALEVGYAADGRELARALVIRDATTGEGHVVALPCAAAPDCTPGAPAWSPDGHRLAFAVRLPGGHARAILSVDADGGDLRHLADFGGTVITLRYSAQGRLAGLAIADAAREAGATEAGTVGAVGQAQRIAVVRDGTLTPVSPPGLFVYEYDWLADGTGFVGTAAPLGAGLDNKGPGESGDARWWSARLYAFEGPGARLVYAPARLDEQVALPKLTPDGRSVAFVAGLMSDYDAPGGDAFVVPLDGTASPRPLAAGLDGTVTGLVRGCGGELVASVLAGEATALVALDPGAGAARLLWQAPVSSRATEGAVSLGCGGANRSTGRAAAIRESFTDPPEIVAGPLAAMRPVTAENAGQPALARALGIVWTSDGMAEQGWLLLPAGPASKPWPVVVLPHGGPAWSYQPGFVGSGTVATLLSHGIAAFLPNPRGSYGHGAAFTRANRRDFGGGDYRDVLAGLDAALAAAPLDAGRIGVAGVSYGGFMAMWAAGHGSRFRAAVAQAGISDWVSYAGQTGIPGWLPPYFGATAAEDRPAYARASALAGDLRTPTLLLVGADDIECPPAQSEAFAAALRRAGTPAELHVYPGEGHVLRDPVHAADAQARIADWFARYLN